MAESECRQILVEAGARVDQARNRVFFPRELVEGALKMVNQDVILYSKDGQTDLHLRGKRVHLGTGGAAAGGLDMREKARRRARQTLRTFFPEIVPEALDRQLRERFIRDVPE